MAATQSVSAGGVSVAAVCDKILTGSPADQANCSGFLRDVAKSLGVHLPLVNANGLVDYMGSAAGWLKLGHDAHRASQTAETAYFVVAGLKASGNGHVAVVVPGWSVQGFPMGYWGRLNQPAMAGFNASLTKAWTRADLAKVSYFAAMLPKAAT